MPWFLFLLLHIGVLAFCSSGVLFIWYISNQVGVGDFQTIKWCSSGTSPIRRSLTSTTSTSLCPPAFSSGRVQLLGWKSQKVPQLRPLLSWHLPSPSLHQGGHADSRKQVHAYLLTQSVHQNVNLHCDISYRGKLLLHQVIGDSALTKNGPNGQHPDLDPDPPPALRRRLHRLHHLPRRLL